MTDKNNLKLEIPFPTKRIAEIIYHVLRVDSEPKSNVTKEVNWDENYLFAKFYGTSIKQIRVAVNSFFENINLVTDTLNNFGESVSESYSHF